MGIRATKTLNDSLTNPQVHQTTHKNVRKYELNQSPELKRCGEPFAEDKTRGSYRSRRTNMEPNIPRAHHHQEATILVMENDRIKAVLPESQYIKSLSIQSAGEMMFRDGNRPMKIAMGDSAEAGIVEPEVAKVLFVPQVASATLHYKDLPVSFDDLSACSKNSTMFLEEPISSENETLSFINSQDPSNPLAASTRRAREHVCHVCSAGRFKRVWRRLRNIECPKKVCSN